MRNNPKKVLNRNHGAGRFFIRRKKKPFHTKNYLDFLVHYNAELVQTGRPIKVVGCKTGVELLLEPKAKLQMVKLLLDEFGTVDEVNKAIGNYRVSHP